MNKIEQLKSEARETKLYQYLLVAGFTKEFDTLIETSYNAGLERAVEEKDDLLDDMWGLICNVNGGIVEEEKPEWYEAFLRIRNKYLSQLQAEVNKE